MKKLIFGKGNAKLSKDIATFSLPAGFTCPAAFLCQSWADRETGKIRDGKATTFRCFAASQESAFPSVRRARWHNFDMLQGKTKDEMVDIIMESLPSSKYVRVHVSGDFYSIDYLNAWLDVADLTPETTFYAYTKSLHLLAQVEEFAQNFVFTLSHGGKYDQNIPNFPFKSAKVILDPIEAEIMGLEVDHDDSHAYNAEGKDFALLIHGQQPKGSDASKAIKALKAANVQFSYTTKK
jgi:hypothetical protein